MDNIDIIARYLKFQVEYHDLKNKEKFIKDELEKVEKQISEYQPLVLNIIKEQNK